MAKQGLQSLLIWEKNRQAKERVNVAISCDEKELADEIRATLTAQGFSESIINKQITKALEMAFN